MTNAKSIFPKGEALRSAMRWISRMHDYNLKTIEEASQRYNLSPVEEEFIMRHFLYASLEKDTREGR
jgi:aerobic-type carbon monoxide dehydrogenase small subunit (CoxS/CutS family)